MSIRPQSAEPFLTHEACQQMVRELFAPGSEFAIGVELELFSKLPDGSRPQMESLHELLDELSLPGGGRITLEPGSQVELASRPLGSIKATLDAVKADLDVIKSTLQQSNIELWASGIDTTRAPKRMESHPRYRMMEERFDAYSSAGRWMMNNTGSLQININNCPVQPLRQWEMLWKVNPLLTAIFANSSGNDLCGQKWSSLRQGCWRALDPTLTGPVAFQDGPEGYTRFALHAPLLVIKNETGGVIEWRKPSLGLTLFDWINDPELVGRPATADDFIYHLTTLFPDIRPRRWMEVRSLDMLNMDHAEVAMTLLATISVPEVTDQILQAVPEISTMTASRAGLESPKVAAAAKLLFEIAMTCPVELPGSNPESLHAFYERFTSRSLTPDSLNFSEEQAFAPDLRKAKSHLSSHSTKLASQAISCCAK